MCEPVDIAAVSLRAGDDLFGAGRVVRVRTLGGRRSDGAVQADIEGGGTLIFDRDEVVTVRRGHEAGVLGYDKDGMPPRSCEWTTTRPFRRLGSSSSWQSTSTRRRFGQMCDRLRVRQGGRIYGERRARVFMRTGLAHLGNADRRPA